MNLIQLNLVVNVVVILEIYETLHSMNKERRKRFTKKTKRKIAAGLPAPLKKKRRKTTPTGLSSNLNNLQNLAL